MASSPPAPFLDRGEKIVAARVSDSAPATYLYPDDGLYYARDDETPSKICKMFNVNLERFLRINKEDYPEMLSNSKLKGGTRVVLPARDLRWMLTEQLGKGVKMDKKKRYTVRDIEPDVGSVPGAPKTGKMYENIESKRVQEYPQLSNTYTQGEIVCALWPDVLDEEPDPANNQHWLTEFSYAIFLGFVDGDPSRAFLKYENNDYTLDHDEQDKIRAVPVSVIIKREKEKREREDREGDGIMPGTSEIAIVDPAFEEMGMRKFIYDSMTKHWHDSLHTSRAVRFRFHMSGESGLTAHETVAHRMMQDNQMQETVERPPTPPSPARYSSDQVLKRCHSGDEAAGAQALWVPEMTAKPEGQCSETAEEAGTQEEREKSLGKPHMSWWYRDAAGLWRSWTARRPIDTLTEPAPYVVLW